jgi:hypothetical protein
VGGDGDRLVARVCRGVAGDVDGDPSAVADDDENARGRVSRPLLDGSGTSDEATEQNAAAVPPPMTPPNGAGSNEQPQTSSPPTIAARTAAARDLIAPGAPRSAL